MDDILKEQCLEGGNHIFLTDGWMDVHIFCYISSLVI